MRLFFNTLIMKTLEAAFLSINFLCFWLVFPFSGLRSKEKLTASQTVICGKTYRNIDKGMLFQDIKRLDLNCDSTFTFVHHSCLGSDTSFGTWRLRDGIAWLYTTEKIKKLHRKQVFFKDGWMLRDFTNSTISFQDSLAIWTINETFDDMQQERRIDTLKLN
jgi:hypothetical protein